MDLRTCITTFISVACIFGAAYAERKLAPTNDETEISTLDLTRNHDAAAYQANLPPMPGSAIVDQ